MKNLTMKAMACIPSARPRPSGTVPVAGAHFGDQSTAVSAAMPKGLRVLAVIPPFAGVVTADATSYLTTDVVRSPFGRPPV